MQKAAPSSRHTDAAARRSEGNQALRLTAGSFGGGVVPFATPAAGELDCSVASLQDEETLLGLPAQVESLVDAISALPGVAGCFCRPKGLEQFKPEHLSLPGEFGDLPQAIIRRTNGGLTGEVMLQTEVIFDRSPAAWLSIEFLAWWVRDWGRAGRDIQFRPMALPPKAFEIQLGRTLKFFIEYFVIEEDDSYDKTLAVAAEMGRSIADNYASYRECFENPAEFTGDVESI